MDLIVHHNDMDGFVAKMFAEISLEKVKSISVDYTYNHKDLLKYPANTTLHVLDFSFKPKDFLELKKYFKDIVWIDHHKCIEDPEYKELEYLSGFRRIGTSGAALSYEYYFAPTENIYHYKTDLYKKIASLVDAYDCWKTESEHYKDGVLLNTFFYVQDQTLDTLCEEMVNGFKIAKLFAASRERANKHKCAKTSRERNVLMEFGLL